MEGKSIASYILSGVAILIEVVSLFVFGWLGVIGLIMGAVGIGLADEIGGRIVGGFATAFGLVATILYIIALAIIF